MYFKPNMWKVQIAISSDLCIRLTWNLTCSCGQQQRLCGWSRISYGGKTIPRWRTAAILKIDISPYLGEKPSNFYEILYTAADFELDECHVIKNEKVALDRLRVWQNIFLVLKVFVVIQEVQYTDVYNQNNCQFPLVESLGCGCYGCVINTYMWQCEWTLINWRTCHIHLWRNDV